VTLSGLPATGVLSGGEGLWKLCGMFGHVQSVRLLHGAGGVACVQMTTPDEASCIERFLSSVLETRLGRHPSWFASALITSLPQPPRSEACSLPPSCGLSLLEPLPPGVRLESIVGMTGAVCSGAEGSTLWFSSTLDAAAAAARWNGALIWNGARLKLRFAAPHRSPPATPPPAHITPSPPVPPGYMPGPLSPPLELSTPPPGPPHLDSGADYWSHGYHHHSQSPYSTYAPTPGPYSTSSSGNLATPHCDTTPLSSSAAWQSPLFVPHRQHSIAAHHLHQHLS